MIESAPQESSRGKTEKAVDRNNVEAAYGMLQGGKLHKEDIETHFDMSIRAVLDDPTEDAALREKAQALLEQLQ